MALPVMTAQKRRNRNRAVSPDSAEENNDREGWISQ
jgi:hypothetical protein